MYYTLRVRIKRVYKKEHAQLPFRITKSYALPVFAYALTDSAQTLSTNRTNRFQEDAFYGTFKT